MKEKKDRVDDAMHATRAAVEEGIVPGGGVALIRAEKAIDALNFDNADQKTGAAIIRRAIEEPLRQIVQNAGLEGSVVVNKVKEGKDAFGYNAKTDTYEDLIKAGVIDPAKVTRTALKNASSIASMILTTDCVITEKKEPKPAAPAMDPGMGGMGSLHLFLGHLRLFNRRFFLSCNGLFCHGIVFRILRAFGFGLGLLAQRFVDLGSPFVSLAHRGIVAISQTEIGKSTAVVLHLHADLRSQVIRFGISRIVGQDGAVFPEGLFIFALRLEAGTLFYTRIGSKRRRKTNQYSKSKYGS